MVGSDGFEPITDRALNAVPLPLGYEPMVFVVRFELTRNTALDRTRLPVAPHERTLVGAPGFEPDPLKRELVLRTSAANRIRLTPEPSYLRTWRRAWESNPVARERLAR